MEQHDHALVKEVVSPLEHLEWHLEKPSYHIQEGEAFALAFEIQEVEVTEHQEEDEEMHNWVVAFVNNFFKKPIESKLLTVDYCNVTVNLLIYSIFSIK